MTLGRILGLKGIALIATLLLMSTLITYIAQAGIHVTYYVVLYTPAHTSTLYAHSTGADDVYIWLHDYCPKDYYYWYYAWGFVRNSYYWILVVNYGDTNLYTTFGVDEYYT